jgi:hypothetical protein
MRRLLLNGDGEFEWLPARKEPASIMVRSRVIRLPGNASGFIEAAIEEEVFYASAVRDAHDEVVGLLYTLGPSTKEERERAREMLERGERA